MELLINELARQVDLPAKTIRYYEDIGFIPPARRNSSNYRVYGSKDVQKLNFIKKARAMGFSISEIKDLISIREEGHYPCSQVINLLKTHIEDINQKIEDLIKFRDKLNNTLSNFQDHHEEGRKGQICGLVENLFEE